MILEQTSSHLNNVQRTNQGAFYTPTPLIESVFQMLEKQLPNTDNYTLLDSSCGYGAFLRPPFRVNQVIGCDIDPLASRIAAQNAPKATIITASGLKNVDRHSFGIAENAPLIIVGNPPYNDTTSLIKRSIKKENYLIDSSLKTRDLGLSFLLSYQRLNADYVCVLHPLSYLIKKNNFKMLSAFTSHYRLIDSLIVSSGEFEQTSRNTFPIIIGLYKKGEGMSYEEFANLHLPTKEGHIFCLSSLNSIADYIDKYPNKKKFDGIACAFFWTQRDINALKRNKTFIKEEGPQTVSISLEKLPYYCYIDVFKTFISQLPYHFGNCDVFLDHEEFLKIADCFVLDSLTRHPWLPVSPKADKEYSDKIVAYFNKLFKSKIHI
ncbi:MAG: SAM-dependent methyltransferase [Brevinema sp.]